MLLSGVHSKQDIRIHYKRRCHTWGIRNLRVLSLFLVYNTLLPTLSQSLRTEDPLVKMFLQYYLDENGDRVYTLKKVTPEGTPTSSAHPARFSPDDKFSRHRITLKKRFGILLTQQPKPIL